MKNKVLKKEKKGTLKDYLWDFVNSTETLLNEEVDSVLIFASNKKGKVETLALGIDPECTIDTLINLKVNIIEQMLEKLGIDTKALFAQIELEKNTPENIS